MAEVTEDGRTLPAEDEPDCSEGCDHPDGFHKWEIEPSPSADFDYCVTDDDQHALQLLLDVAESKWDQMKPGEEVVIKIRMHKP
jgi:hypothetical protein